LLAFDLLAPTCEVLQYRCAADVSPLQRFAYWAMQAKGNRPYLEAMDRANFLRGTYPDLLTCIGFPEVSYDYMGDWTTPVMGIRKRHQNSISSYGMVRAHIWELELSAAPAVNVVFLGHGSMLPWCIRKPALDMLAHSICRKHTARLYALNTDQLPPGALQSSMQFVDAFCEMFRSLHLEGPTILVCCGTGMLAALCWRLRSRLVGAMVINFTSRCDADDILNAVMLRSNLYREAFAATPDDILRVEQNLSVAYDAAPTSFWGTATNFPKWGLVDVEKAIANEPPLELPMTIVCGSLAETEAVHRASLRLRRLVPGAPLFYIPESKMFWEAEGVEQQRSVAGFLGAFMSSILCQVETLTTQEELVLHSV